MSPRAAWRLDSLGYDAYDYVAKTIRYYESIGLLPEPGRTDAGYRRYAQDDVERLTFIRRAQQLDLTLDEIREILALRERGTRPCSYVLNVAETRLEQLERRIADLRRVRDELSALLQRAADLSDENGCYCELIEQQPTLTQASPRRSPPTRGHPVNIR